MLIRLIQFLLGFVKKDKDKLAILTQAVKGMYHLVTAEDILHEENGTWVFEGKPMTQAEVTDLKQQAQTIRGTKIWRVIQRDIQYQVNKKMFDEIVSPNDIHDGKLVLFLNSCIKERLRKM